METSSFRITLLVIYQADEISSEQRFANIYLAVFLIWAYVFLFFSWNCSRITSFPRLVGILKETGSLTRNSGNLRRFFGKSRCFDNCPRAVYKIVFESCISTACRMTGTADIRASLRMFFKMSRVFLGAAGVLPLCLGQMWWVSLPSHFCFCFCLPPKGLKQCFSRSLLG